MNKIKIIALFIPLIGLFGWAMYFAIFIKNAQIVHLPIQGYDPRNLLSGHYIQFQIEWEKADCQQSDWKGSCPKADFIGINRYYVPENRAKELERIINNQNIRTEINFAYQKGKRPIAKELLIDGKVVLH